MAKEVIKKDGTKEAFDSEKIMDSILVKTKFWLRHQDKQINERQKKALEYVKKNKSLKSQTYLDINKVSSGTAVKEINEMVHFKYLKKVGSFRGAYYILNEEKPEK